MPGVYQFVKGYFTVTARGRHTEKLLNMALVHRIYLWNVRRFGEDSLSFCVSRKGYAMMKDYAVKTRCTMEITAQDGVPTWWQVTKKRRVFFLSALLSAAVVLASASFLWTVDITGEVGIPHEEIRQKLASYGLKAGSVRKTVDYTAVTNRLITDFEEILWANVELEGTRLLVTLVPRTKAPELIPKDIPVNIVAKKDGFIKEITAENGEAMVREGDTVVKGQILISGLIPSPAVGTRYLHAMGEITAITWEERTAKQPCYRYDKVFTNREKIHREIWLPFLKIPLDFSKTIDFYNYDSIIKERNFLFLTYRETVYSEYTLQKTAISVEEAVSLAQEALIQELYREGIGEFVSKTTDYTLSEDGIVTVTVLAECVEELGVSKEIVKPTERQ